MKSLLVTGLILLLVGMLIFSGCATPSPVPAPAPTPSSASPAKVSPPSPAKTIELSLSTTGGTDFGPGVPLLWWSQELEKRTEGRVKVTIYRNETLTKSAQMYDGVLKGIANMARGVISVNRGRFPLSEGFELPLGYPSSTVSSQVFWELYKKFKPAEFNETHMLFLCGGGPPNFHTKRPIRTLADVKGMKIRSTGSSAKIVEALGGVPVGMPQTESYEALQKGTVEANYAPSEILYEFKQAEVIKYTTPVNSISAPAGFYFIMNLNTWNSLPPDIQKIIDEISDKYPRLTGENWDKEDKMGLDYSQKLGNEILSLSPGEDVKFTEAVKSIPDAWVKDMEAKGLPGKDYLAEARRLIKEYSK